MGPDLERFFRPRTVAVIGPSATPGRPTHGMWTKVRTWAERNGAEVIPVTPSHATLDGYVCVPTIADVEAPVDLAVILVADAVGTFAEVCRAGARFAVIFAAGFAESGPDGGARQAELDALVAAGPTRLLGPNTNLNAFEPFRADLPGPRIALITQSGHQGRPVYAAQEQGIALSHWAPTGNEADLEFADFARWFADQPEVGVIAAYIEGFKDGAALIDAATHAARAGVPIVCVKVGRTEAGTSMAQSHTGHLAGADRVVDAAFRQHGVVRVDGLDELTDVAAMFARTRPAPGAAAPRGRGVCVYSISGGTSAHMADLLAAAGLDLPELAPRTQAALRECIPGYLRVSNPVDSGGPPTMDERGRRIVDAILADPAVDVLVCPITGAVEAISRPLATDLVAAAATSPKPIFVVWGSPDLEDPVYREILLPSGLPLFRTFGNCVRAAQAYVDHAAFLAREPSPSPAPRVPATAARRAGRVLAAAPAGAPLDEHASKALVRAYGIRTTRDVLCATASETAAAATAAGGPVVLKVCSPDLPHKTEHGLVEVGVSSARAARAMHGELLRRARRADPDARIAGVLVCEQAAGGVEAMVGVHDDPLFGPVVAVGVGGALVELYDDLALRVPPFDAAEVHRLLDELRGRPLLDGWRGAPAVDVDALVDVVLRVQQLALDHAGTLAELDLNPVLVRPRGALVLDALAVPR